MLKRLNSLIRHRPVHVVSVLLIVVLIVEFGQYAPEMFTGAHAVGEVFRNLAYALVGAVIFQWLIVELPAQRLRRSTYAFHEMSFQLLLTTGPGLLYQYQSGARQLGGELDVWNQTAIVNHANLMASVDSRVFGPERAGLMKTAVEIGVPRALAELAPSAAYLDPEVAHALSTFPRQEGITVLQVKLTSDGGIDPGRDAHITWQLLEASRRLYAALLSVHAYDRTLFQGSVGDPPVQLSDDVLVRPEAAQDCRPRP